MTGRNRDAETTLPFSHLARACPDITGIPLFVAPFRLAPPVSRSFSLVPRRLRLYCYFRPWITSGIDNVITNASGHLLIRFRDNSLPRRTLNNVLRVPWGRETDEIPRFGLAFSITSDRTAKKIRAAKKMDKILFNILICWRPIAEAQLTFEFKKNGLWKTVSNEIFSEETIREFRNTALEWKGKRTRYIRRNLSIWLVFLTTRSVYFHSCHIGKVIALH